MNIDIVPVTAFEQNCTVLWCEATRRAAVVDPGGDLPRITARDSGFRSHYPGHVLDNLWSDVTTRDSRIVTAHTIQ